MTRQTAISDYSSRPTDRPYNTAHNDVRTPVSGLFAKPVVPQEPNWRDRDNTIDWSAAAYRGQNPDLWFPERGAAEATYQAAIDVCNRCPIRQQCADYAIENNEIHGIWGGIGGRQRKRIQAERGLEATA